MPKLLTRDQIDAFERDGYLAPIPVLSSHEVRTSLAAFEKYEIDRWGVSGRTYDDEAGIEFLREPHRHAQWAYDLVTHPRVLDAVEDILEENVLVWDSKLFPKPPRSISTVTWHQDGTYIGLEPLSKVITAWIALTDSLPENGSMQVLPGSHKSGQLPHGKSGVPGNMLRHDQTISQDINFESVVNVPLRAGEMSLHSMMLVHGSLPNSSDKRRVGMSVNYLTPDVREAGDYHRSVIVGRGEDRYGHFQRFAGFGGAL